MADIMKTTQTVKIGLETEQGKTKYISIDNPRSDLTAASVKSAAQYLIDNKVIWNVDSYGNVDSYTSVATAYTEEKRVIELDLD